MFYAVYNHGKKPASIKLEADSYESAEAAFNAIDHEAAKTRHDIGDKFEHLRGDGLREEEYAYILRAHNGHPFAFPDLRDDYKPEHLGFVLWILS